MGAQAIVGHATFNRDDPTTTAPRWRSRVADAYQGNGLGTILLAHLAEPRPERGVPVFEAEVLPHNHRMLGVFRESGFAVRCAHRAPTSERRVPDRAVRRGARALRASASARRPRPRCDVPAPASVAVIGASRERGTVGGEIFHNLLATEFNGPGLPGQPARAGGAVGARLRVVRDILADVDLAVIAVPAALRAGRRAPVRGQGRAGAGGDLGRLRRDRRRGRARQAELLRICREAGMRLVGPNCIGVLNPTRRCG